MRRIFSVSILGLALVAMEALPARAEVAEVRLTQQFGLSYLPLIVARVNHLIEKQAKAAGIDDLKVSFTQLSGGAAINDALLAGAVDYGVAGIAPALVAWDKTRGNADIKAVAALDSIAVYLNTNKASIRNIKDFTEADRIAVPAVKVSIQSVLLQIAAEQAWGPGEYGRLDPLTVSMKHPDANAALLSGLAGLSAHFAQPPYSLTQLETPHIHKLLSSHEILGGPATLNLVYTTTKFREQNPKVYGSVLAALREADAFIAANPASAARIYVEEEKPGKSVEYMQGVIASRILGDYSVVPFGTLRIADFLYRTGTLRGKPSSWRDYFFPEIHDQAGS